MRPTIAQRIMIGIAIIVLLVGTIAAYSAYTLRQIDQANMERNRMTDARKTVRSLDIDVLRIIIDLQYFVNEKDNKYVADIVSNREKAKDERVKLRSLTSNQKTLALLHEYEALLPDRIKSADAIIAAVKDDAPVSQLAQLQNERRMLDDEARTILRDMIKIEEASSAAALTAVSASIASARTNLLHFVFIVGLIVAGIAYYLYRSIVGPLKQLTKMAQDIKKGKLTAVNSIDSHDEMGVLGNTMNNMAQELQRVDEVKSNFISIASHQLRTPATAVKQYLGLIIEGFATKEEDKSRFVRDAYESNEYQLAIINDILNVARVEAGNFELQKTPTDINELVRKAYLEQKSTLKSGQKLIYNTPKSPIKISVDETKIKMCVGNLLSNAIKYTPEDGQISLHVSYGKDGVSITVEDTGVGIAPEDMSKLFAKFSRVNNELSTKVGGTGLGLYLVRELVRLHGGDVEVESVPSKGSAFIIKLPKE